MRLLCFHGKYQNGLVFAQKTLKLQERLSGFVDLHYVNGPCSVVPKILENRVRTNISVTHRAWWNENSGPMNPDLIHCITRTIKTNGPFDGVLGFSQGAVLASMLCTKKISSLIGWNPKVALLFGGYISNELEKDGVVEGLRSMHIYGLNDHVVSSNRSGELALMFKKNQTSTDHVFLHEHQQGHIIPTNNSTLNAVSYFLRNEASVNLLTNREDITESSLVQKVLFN